MFIYHYTGCTKLCKLIEDINRNNFYPDHFTCFAHIKKFQKVTNFFIYEKNIASFVAGFETGYNRNCYNREHQIFGNFNHNRNQNFYPQLTGTITIHSLQKRMITGNKKLCKKTKWQYCVC